MPDISSFLGTGFVRLSSILAPKGPIPISKSSWYAGIQAGKYPKPVKISPGVSAWRKEDITALLRRLNDA